MGNQDVIEVEGMSRREIRIRANRARQLFKLKDGPLDCGSLIEQLFDFGITVDVRETLPPGIEAAYDPAGPTLYILESVYIEMCQGGKRATFTLGHELGHIVLMHTRTLNRAVRASDIPPYRNSEWQADAFGGEFTMPLDQILKYRLFDEIALAEHFGVSERAAEVRLQILRAEKEKPLGVSAPRGFK